MPQLLGYPTGCRTSEETTNRDASINWNFAEEI